MSLSGNQKTRLGISTFGVGKSYPFVNNSILGTLASTDQNDTTSSTGIIGGIVSGTLNVSEEDDSLVASGILTAGSAPLHILRNVQVMKRKNMVVIIN